MLIDLSLLFDSGGKREFAARPIRMGFFHFSNSNLSIRKQCARELGMYDPAATKAEDVDLCFRLALSPKWVAWRENDALVRHKGRHSLWALIKQMWGWGWHLAYPYSKTGIRGVFIYWLGGRDHSLISRIEITNFPMLVCLFVTDFYIVNALILSLLCALCFGHYWIALAAICGLFWAAPRYLHDVMQTGLSSWDTFKLAVVQYLANLAFTVPAAVGALPHGMLLLSPSVFKLEGPESPLNVPTRTNERPSTI